jgi:hypothetical protein
MGEQLMKNDNVTTIRNAYAVAERKDLGGWIDLFTPDAMYRPVSHCVAPDSDLV